MKILIAEDEPISRRVLEATLQRRNFETVVVSDGEAALAALAAADGPPIGILDWMMPGLDGAEVCRRLRRTAHPRPPYIILLTARDRKEDLVEGLSAGANDYIVKPFDNEELHARVQVGRRVVELQEGLAQRVAELEQALVKVRQLQGLLPICSYCKSIRNDNNYWMQLEGYLTEHSEAQFSHGICPRCYDTHVQGELDQLRASNRDQAEAEACSGPAAPGGVSLKRPPPIPA